MKWFFFYFHKWWRLKYFSGIFLLIFNSMSVFVKSLLFYFQFYFQIKTFKNNQVKLFHFYIKLLNKSIKTLTVCTSEIYGRKYSGLSESSFALCKSMLPWQMFSLLTGLAEGGRVIQCTSSNGLAVFINPPL